MLPHCDSVISLSGVARSKKRYYQGPFFLLISVDSTEGVRNFRAKLVLDGFRPVDFDGCQVEIDNRPTWVFVTYGLPFDFTRKRDPVLTTLIFSDIKETFSLKIQGKDVLTLSFEEYEVELIYLSSPLSGKEERRKESERIVEPLGSTVIHQLIGKVRGFFFIQDSLAYHLVVFPPSKAKEGDPEPIGQNLDRRIIRLWSHESSSMTSLDGTSFSWFDPDVRVLYPGFGTGLLVVAPVPSDSPQSEEDPCEPTIPCLII